ncbi:hypothetical protein [Lactiplantibacillus modestisalitolerans]|uniref:ABC transporter permease n=1 Tax=Lactiplantibacillus modestisalitolerans TaxID=1457219 RepID=A0ABV5WWV0_9LACO|nr:hypothetical protein [Lactiplantibacillus modestisalitolerans]
MPTTKSKTNPKTTASESTAVQAYTDHYFERGHWLLKIWQTIVGLIGWLAVFIPIIATGLSFWSQYDSRVPRLWSYREGVFEIKFIGIILLFCFVFAALFTLTMTIIQNRKRDRLVEQWPTYNPITQKRRQQLLAQFMTTRFGTPEFRQNVRTYHVKPEQNLDTDAIRKLYQDHDLDELDE